MVAEDLIEGKWYKFLNSFGEEIYFPFREIKDGNIYGYGDKDAFFIFKRKLTHVFNLNTDGVFIWKDEGVDVFEEISYDEVINIMPDNNVIKINYLRKQRIKKLLYENK